MSQLLIKKRPVLLMVILAVVIVSCAVLLVFLLLVLQRALGELGEDLTSRVAVFWYGWWAVIIFVEGAIWTGILVQIARERKV